MTGHRWYASPLAGTGAVLATLGLLAIPLRQLTSARAVPAPVAAAPAVSPKETPAVLRLKLLDAVTKLTIAGPDGRLLLDTGPLPAGESEHDAVIPFEHGIAELTLHADAGDEETAVFLTVMPEGLEDRTLWLAGSGTLEETLRYEWHVH